jgi:hypothetical protein
MKHVNLKITKANIINGVAVNPGKCPIANSILENVKNAYYVCVLPDQVAIKVKNGNKITAYKSNTPKVAGTFIKKFDDVILLDDDHTYNKDMLEIFYREASLNIKNSYSFCVQKVKDCYVGQGADGFLINTKYLNLILNFYKKFVKNNSKLFYNDDLWISIYLNKLIKIKIKSLNKFLKKSFFKKNTSVYKKHTTINALIEEYNLNRKLARNLRYNENSLEYLRLKKQTANFKKLNY